jgi:hypothetical protein
MKLRTQNPTTPTCMGREPGNESHQGEIRETK